ncbi:MAG: hypothetical protein KGH65_04440 [Candidatus Micrarchaeota archaeon]|nr:hypothetical protein [Candidatus Micrarchaeota archaeon]
MQSDQLAALVATVLTLLLTVGLAIALSRKYMEKRRPSLLFWSLGIWVFAFTVLLEAVFAIGIYTSALIDAYLFLVALLVELLALGSIQLIKNRLIKNAYYALAAIGAAATAYSVAVGNVGNLLMQGVVAALPPDIVIYASSLATFPAATVLVIVAAMGYRRTRSLKMVSIIAGVVVVSVAGTLYIASFPSFLYYAEFAGMLLLWMGFYDFRR